MSVAHPKRSFGKYPKIIDSPAYDASEEDNDPLTDENSNSNTTSAPVPRPNANTNAPTTTSAVPGGPSRQTKAPTAGGGGAPQKPRHHLAQHIALASDSDGVDSPTYDGDIESSTTYGADTPNRPAAAQLSPSPSPSPEPELGHGQEQELEPPTTPVVLAPNPLPALSPGAIATANGTSTNMNVSVVQPTPVSTASTPEAHPPRQTHPYSHLPVFISPPPPQRSASTPVEPAVALASLEAFNPASLTPEDIQAFVARAIEGEPGRKYTINAPPTDRPVRVYADGVYDLFHFGHALQLRQAKLSFPSVYLLVGVNSDEQVWSHKARTVMSHAERLESPRHCRWVDEVVPEAPWIIDQAFLDKYSIDYVAHDEDMYASAGCEDVYGYAKSLGKFIPTRRTPGVSTSSLLERIVSGYRNRDFDEKLVKMGHRELCAEGSDYDAQSRVGSRGGSRGGSVAVSRSGSPVEEGKGADRLSPTTAATQTQTLE